MKRTHVIIGVAIAAQIATLSSVAVLGSKVVQLERVPAAMATCEAGAKRAVMEMNPVMISAWLIEAEKARKTGVCGHEEPDRQAYGFTPRVSVEISGG